MNKGKGPEFIQKRLIKRLRDFSFISNENEGYAVVMDFHSYFETIDREILYAKIRPLLKDDRLFELYKRIVENSTTKTGLGLGS